jgi:hypothetical protein
MDGKTLDRSIEKSTIAKALLWLYVLDAGLISGGNLFDQTVLTPMWGWSPPHSVQAWTYGGIQGYFFVPVGLALFLISLALAIVSWRIPGPARNWALVAAFCGLFTMVWSAVFFLPLLMKTQITRGAGLSSEEIVTLTNRFVRWNALRLAIMFASASVALTALTKLVATEARTFRD